VSRSLVGVALLLAALAGCGGEEPAATTSAVDAPVEDSGLGPAGGEEWPDAIPGDIPVLDGEITMIMSDDLSLRMFYAGVSDDDLLDYLAELESLGYDLEYIVYATPGNEERAQERADAGEWDAVRATKGDYRLALEFGEGTGVFDVEGIPMEGFGPDTEWPDAWAGIPAPSALAINQVIDPGNGPLVEVAYESDDDIEGYVAELEGAGFTVVDRAFDQNHDIISVTVSDGTREVYMRTYPGGRLEVQVSEATTVETTGPGGAPAPGVLTERFPDWLPEVPGGELLTASDSGARGFTAVVVIGEGHTVADYVQVLEDAGFTESGSMLAGHVLDNGEWTVTIYGDDNGLAPLQIMIEAKAD
jgi:hypothetical protein